MRALPDWFGIESSIVEYRQALESMETYVACDHERVVGFIAIEEHNQFSSEIHVIAVRPDYRNMGHGRALVHYAEQLLISRSMTYFHVKTLGSSHPSPHYAETRKFYHSLGFRPLEENALWGEYNPCLMMVKCIG